MLNKNLRKALLAISLSAVIADNALADYCPPANSIHYVKDAELWEAPGTWIGAKSVDDGIKTIIAFKQAVYQRFILPGSSLTCRYQTGPKGEILVMGNDKSRIYPAPIGSNWIPDGNSLVCNGPDVNSCYF